MAPILNVSLSFTLLFHISCSILLTPYALVTQSQFHAGSLPSFALRLKSDDSLER